MRSETAPSAVRAGKVYVAPVVHDYDEGVFSSNGRSYTNAAHITYIAVGHSALYCPADNGALFVLKNPAIRTTSRR